MQYIRVNSLETVVQMYRCLVEHARRVSLRFGHKRVRIKVLCFRARVASEVDGHPAVRELAVLVDRVVWRYAIALERIG